jgi:acyl carrier protein
LEPQDDGRTVVPFPHLDQIRELLGSVLELGKRTAKLSAETRLFGSLPELDSMAVVLLVVALEERFGIRFDDEEVTAETFATLGTLAAVVGRKQSP